VHFFANTLYTISLPKNVNVSEVTVTGQAYRASRPSYLVELGGQTFNSDLYTFTRGTESAYTIELDKSATGTLSFQFSADTDVKITLKSGVTSGIKNILKAASSNSLSDNIVYSIDGRKLGSISDLKALPKGVYICNHKKIVNK
jgi:hypothetical protein